uniref:L-type lectin-domain containing protein n=1 Tax=uncultured Cetobacterium sp. TaxID=527638 RepID=UPI0026384CC5
MGNKKYFLLFLLIFSKLLFSAHIEESSKSFKDFKDFKFFGDAERNPTNREEGILTSDTRNQAGAFWYQKKIDLRHNFIYEFDINFGNNGWKKVDLKPSTAIDPMIKYDDDGFDDGYIDIGADGIAFVLQGASNSIYGKKGLNIGTEIKNSYVTEFDTYNNHGYLKNGDLSFPLDELDSNGIPKNITIDHMAFMPYSNQLYSMNHIYGNNTMISIGDVEDGKYHKVQVSWNAISHEYKVIFDVNIPGKRKEMSVIRDIVKEDLNNNPLTYFGFTASTGDFKNLQKIKNIKLIADISNLDFGDAPETYKTLLGSRAGEYDGPSHIIKDGIYLGKGVTAELDGKPSDSALRDSEDDGVVFNKIDEVNTLILNKENNIKVIASQPGCIHIWIDCNKDGKFENNEGNYYDVKSGENNIKIDLKNKNIQLGKTYFRIRYTTGTDFTEI